MTPPPDAPPPDLGDPGDPERLGEVHEGQFNLGPVEWSEATWHNSCSPYPSEVQQLEGVYLAGVNISSNSNRAFQCAHGAPSYFKIVATVQHALARA